jgi:hypothetical protein
VQDRMDPSNSGAVPGYDHEAWGERLLWTMVVLAAVSLVAAALAKVEAPATAVLGATLVVAAVAAVSVGFTIVTGHTGAQSHWSFLYKR